MHNEYSSLSEFLQMRKVTSFGKRSNWDVIFWKWRSTASAELHDPQCFGRRIRWKCYHASWKERMKFSTEFEYSQIYCPDLGGLLYITLNAHTFKRFQQSLCLEEVLCNLSILDLNFSVISIRECTLGVFSWISDFSREKSSHEFPRICGKIASCSTPVFRMFYCLDRRNYRTTRIVYIPIV